MPIFILIWLDWWLGKAPPEPKVGEPEPGTKMVEPGAAFFCSCLLNCARRPRNAGFGEVAIRRYASAVVQLQPEEVLCWSHASCFILLRDEDGAMTLAVAQCRVWRDCEPGARARPQPYLATGVPGLCPSVYATSLFE